MALTVDDLTDIVAGFLLGGKKAANSSQEKKNYSAKRIFLSDYELRKMFIRGEKVLKIPSNAIISPLALDWIDFNDVDIVYED